MALRSILLSASTALVMALTAQDTLHVQTLSFDSITTRRGWFVFPDSTHQYRKVLMHHTLKCSPLTTADQYPCGEWDYLTYNFIHEHTGRNDSTAYQHPLFKVGAASPDSVRVAPWQAVIAQQRWMRTDTLQAVTSETLATVGTGAVGDTNTFRPGSYATRSQYLFTAAELSAAGLVPGPIRGLRFTSIGGPGGWMPKLIVRMKATITTALTGFDDSGLTTVFNGQHTSGALDLLLHEPFVWDGTSGLLMDVSAEEIGVLEGHLLAGDPVAPGMAVHEHGPDGHVEVGDDVIGVDPAPLAALDTAVTITFRAFGAPQLPLNTTVLEAVDAQGRRVLNVHLPWSNGRIYWDAGQDAGYDRIDNAANAQDFQGQWNDWAFVKNTVTGSMKIYLNGVLWHSGTGKTKPLGGITRFNIGCDANRNNRWPGLLDEVNVFATEVDAATIAAWSGRRVTADHPDHAALLYRFGMDENPVFDDVHVLRNHADAAHPAWPLGTVRRDQRDATALGAGSTLPGIRPTTTFVQGDHVTGRDSALVSWPDVRMQPLLTRETFAVQGNGVVPVDTLFGFAGTYSYLAAPDGSLIDSTNTGAALEVNAQLDYFGAPFEVVNNWEIGRYITPYGIGLSLGSAGFRWTFDVTDYQHLLHDSVELSAGNNQELIDLDFELIEGTPPRTVVDHQRPWGPMASRSYGALSSDTQLAPVTVALDDQADQYALRSRLTGHGHNSNDGSYPHCCEWKDNTHYLFADGQQVDAWHVWQTNDCALNPVYPQGGTWLGSREGWCPGDVVKDHWTELTPYATADSLTLDYGITPVPGNNQGMAGGNYVVNMDLFGFTAPAHQLDAEVYLVKRPSNADLYRRDNPICHEPLIVLRNAGAQDLTSVEFAYGVSGGTLKYHTWTGLLKHMEQAEVTLPITDGAFWNGDSEHRFTVSVVSANGAADQHAANDSYTTRFELPVVYNANFIVRIATNNRAYENSVTIRDMVGTVVYSRTNMANNTVYEDTLSLWDGCYTLEVMDTGNDGLSYWADPDQGTGTFRLKKLNGATLKSFQAEFGRSLHWAFALNGFVGVPEAERSFALTAFPNPTTGEVRLRIDDMDGPAQLEVLDAQGRRVHARALELTGTTETLIDLAGQASGLYTVRLVCEGRSAALRVLLQ